MRLVRMQSEPSASARPTHDTPDAPAETYDTNPGGNGYPSWRDPMTGKDKDR